MVKKHKIIYKSGDLSAHPSKKHYRLKHPAITKKDSKFDNDYLNIIYKEDNKDVVSISIGINKKLYRIHDDGYIDWNKDTNFY